MAAIVQCLVIGVLCTAANSFPASAGLVEVGLSVDSAEVLMGRSVILNVQVNYPDGGPAASCLVLPYVDHHRWGAHEITDERGRANPRSEAAAVFPRSSTALARPSPAPS